MFKRGKRDHFEALMRDLTPIHVCTFQKLRDVYNSVDGNDPSVKFCDNEPSFFLCYKLQMLTPIQSKNHILD